MSAGVTTRSLQRLALIKELRGAFPSVPQAAVENAVDEAKQHGGLARKLLRGYVADQPAERPFGSGFWFPNSQSDANATSDTGAVVDVPAVDPTLTKLRARIDALESSISSP